MSSENTITLVGNITEDPELRFTPSGRPVANFTVAVNRRWKDPDGQWQDKLDGFFRCSCWADMAENAAESLKKGTRVVVVGRLQQRSWEDDSGNKRSAVEVQVDEVAPSLRWASAMVQKSERGGARGGNDWSGGGRWSPAGGQGDSGAKPAEGNVSPAPDWGSPAPVGGDEGGF